MGASETEVSAEGAQLTAIPTVPWVNETSGKWVKLERFETNFVDQDGPQGVLGQASGRPKQNVIDWLDARGQAWTDHVQVVAMDPCATPARTYRVAEHHVRASRPALERVYARTIMTAWAALCAVCAPGRRTALCRVGLGMAALSCRAD